MQDKMFARHTFLLHICLLIHTSQLRYVLQCKINYKHMWHPFSRHNWQYLWFWKTIFAFHFLSIHPPPIQWVVSVCQASKWHLPIKLQLRSYNCSGYCKCWHPASSDAMCFSSVGKLYHSTYTQDKWLKQTDNSIHLYHFNRL